VKLPLKNADDTGNQARRGDVHGEATARHPVVGQGACAYKSLVDFLIFDQEETQLQVPQETVPSNCMSRSPDDMSSRTCFGELQAEPTDRMMGRRYGRQLMKELPTAMGEYGTCSRGKTRRLSYW